MPRGNVLIVEDDADLRDALTDLLREEGYSVDGAQNGLEALSRLHSRYCPLVKPATPGPA